MGKDISGLRFSYLKTRLKKPWRGLAKSDPGREGISQKLIPIPPYLLGGAYYLLSRICVERLVSPVVRRRDVDDHAYPGVYQPRADARFYFIQGVDGIDYR